MLAAIIEGRHLVALGDATIGSVLGVDVDVRLAAVHAQHGLEVLERRVHLAAGLALNRGQRVFLGELAIGIERMLLGALMARDRRIAFVDPRLNPQMRLLGGSEELTVLVGDVVGVQIPSVDALLLGELLVGDAGRLEHAADVHRRILVEVLLQAEALGDFAGNLQVSLALARRGHAGLADGDDSRAHGMRDVRSLEQRRHGKHQVSVHGARVQEHVYLHDERNVLHALLHAVRVRPLGHGIALGDPHEVDLGGLVLADPLTEARHGNGLVLNSIGVGLIGRAAGHQGGGAAGVVHAVAAMADMTAEQGQIHLGSRSVSSILGALVAAHVLDDHGMLGVSVIAGDASDVVVGAAGLGLDGLLAPLVGLGLDEIVDGHVVVGDLGAFHGQQRRHASGIVGDNRLGRRIVHLIRGVVSRVSEGRRVSLLVNEARRRGVGDDVLLIGQTLVDDHLQHGERHSRVGAGPRLDPLLGLVGSLGEERIDGAQGATIVHHLLEAAEIARHRDDRVVAPGNDVVGVGDLVADQLHALAENRRQARVDAGAAHIAGRGRATAEPTDKRGERTGQGAEVARTALGHDGLGTAIVQCVLQLLLNEIERLVPGDLLEVAGALLAHELEGLGQALVGVAQLHAGEAAGASGALVHLAALHFHELAVAHITLQQVVLALRRAATVDELAVGELVLAGEGQTLPLVLGRRLVGGRRGASGQAHSSRSRGSAHEGATGELGVNGAFAVLRHRTLLPQIGFSRKLRRKDV